MQVNSAIKISLLTVAIGAVVFLLQAGKNQITQWADQLVIKFAGIGKPQMRNGNVTLPITLLITNPAPVPVPVSNVYGTLFIFRNTLWQPIGQIAPTGAITIAPGTNSQTIFPIVDITKLLGINSWGNVLQSLNTFVLSGQVAAKIKADVTVNVQGFEFNQSLEQAVNLNEFISAAA